MKKILLSVLTIGLVSAIAFGATRAYFSDTETSAGNTFTAGSIDLGIGNDSWYNGVEHPTTDWSLTYDLDDGSGPSAANAYRYFEFEDIKPGDWGEDTIEFRVHDNDAWICLDTTLDTSAENTVTEPEDDLGDTGADGELDDEIPVF